MRLEHPPGLTARPWLKRLRQRNALRGIPLFFVVWWLDSIGASPCCGRLASAYCAIVADAIVSHDMSLWTTLPARSLSELASRSCQTTFAETQQETR